MLTALDGDLLVWGLRLIEANGLWFEASSAGCLGPMVSGLKVARPPNKVALKLSSSCPGLVCGFGLPQPVGLWFGNLRSNHRPGPFSLGRFDYRVDFLVINMLKTGVRAHKARRRWGSPV